MYHTKFAIFDQCLIEAKQLCTYIYIYYIYTIPQHEMHTNIVPVWIIIR
jgi:hypothetical protein